MSKKKEEDARLMRRSLEDNTRERNTYIKMTVDSLSGAGKASVKQILDRTRHIIKDRFLGEVGAKFATNISNEIRLEHINEYKDTIQTGKGQSPFAIFILLLAQHQSDWADKRS